MPDSRTDIEVAASDRVQHDESWHSLDTATTIERLDSTVEGLTVDEAASRQRRFGPNTTVAARATPVWTILLDQLKSVVVGLLFVATVLAWLFGDVLEAVAILTVLALNALIGFFVELRATRSMEALLRLDVGDATVLRDGRAVDLEARELVPGDVILLEAGQAVPADARLIETSELRAEEASLTGESASVAKDADPPLPADTPVADRSNCVYKGTSVASGSGRAIVIATGSFTEVGRIGTLTAGLADEKTPLEVRLDTLGRRLVLLTLAIAAAVTGLGLLRGFEALAMIEAGIALAIAAVPEGLPAVATVTLGLGLRRMARRNALIRRLPAVEALGSATTICTDKTGTLTAGRMAVVRLFLADADIEVSGDGYEPEGEFTSRGSPIAPAAHEPLLMALRICALVNRSRVERDEAGAWTVSGDPTEGALIVAARKAGIERDALLADWPETDSVPFSSERRFMATVHAGPNGLRTFVKGDPGAIIDRCRTALTVHGVVPLDDEGRRRVHEQNAELAGAGLRILALAFTDGGDAGADLTYAGLAGLIDPPVTGVDDTVAKFRAAGIRIVMITGDQGLTAEAIARELQILRDGDVTLDGRDLARMTDSELTEAAGHVAVFCRVSPSDKLRIVGALQERGEIVAMLGDGVNDAAALKKASIGVAMGQRGTDVAREAADVVLTDDRFDTVSAAIEEGRVIFDNIRKFVFYLFSCNLAEVMVLMLAMLVGLPLPLLPLQILWLNLVTDTFPAFALALEPADPDVMVRAPRDPEAALLSRPFLGRIAFHAGLITASSLGAFIAGLRLAPASAVTMCFMTLSFSQILHLGNARSSDPVLKPSRALANRWAIAAVLLSSGLQIITVAVPPLRELLQLSVLAGRDWGIVIALSLMPAVVGQAVRLKGDGSRLSDR